ncbi:MAG TPA: gliding motility protein [Desulfobacteraceae bacterium]|nr:gliding motility protein [Desulfobacteraceae bacterium]|tara:strand:+ start:1773 stop:2156 length:384 start_codon:yes stop_codon:yes gene_type:complete
MFSHEQLNAIDKVIKTHLIDSGVENVIYIDLAGNAITQQDNGNQTLDYMAFAALAAGNFAAVDAMAKLIGESEFSLLFHKGTKSSIHFSKVTEDTILISMFSKTISLGLVRLKVSEAVAKINAICGA